MLEGLTPGATVIVSACSFLLCLGIFWSIHVYLLPYIRQRRLGKQPVLPQSTHSTTNIELQQSLYSSPGLLYRCPRGSLADCELRSSRWSTDICQYAPVPSPRRSFQPPIHIATMRRPQVLQSVTMSDLRQSLISQTSLAMPTENSCSTITTVGHADSDVPPPMRRYRHSVRASTDGTNVNLQITHRRNSAPALLVIKDTVAAVDIRDASLTTIQPSPTDTTFISNSPQEQGSKIGSIMEELDTIPMTVIFKTREPVNLDID